MSITPEATQTQAKADASALALHRAASQYCAAGTPGSVAPLRCLQPSACEHPLERGREVVM